MPDEIAKSAATHVTPTPKGTPPIKDGDPKRKYWFKDGQFVTVVNPTPDNFEFMAYNTPYLVKSGQPERLPGPVASVYLQRMVSILAQNDDQLLDLTDQDKAAHYYDDLIADVEG